MIAGEHQIAGRRQQPRRAVADRDGGLRINLLAGLDPRIVVEAPDFLAGHGVPRLDVAALLARARRAGGIEQGGDGLVTGDAGVVGVGLEFKVFRRRVAGYRLGDRDVHQAGLRAEGHRVPVVGPESRRIDDGRNAIRRITDCLIDLRAAGLQVDVGRPVLGRVLVGADQFAGLGIPHIEEALLGRLHQDVAHFAVDHQVGGDQRVGVVVVPLVARHLLVVPPVLAGLGVQRDDRGDEQVVAAPGAAQFLRPGQAVAGAEIHHVGLGIVQDVVPSGRAAALLPVLVALPGGRGLLEHLVLVGLRGIARHGVETPLLLAGFRIVGRHIAAHVIFGAGVTDDDAVGGELWHLGDGVDPVRIGGLHGPDEVASLGVERLKAAV